MTAAELALMIAGALLLGVPPLVPCPYCGRLIPAWRLREGACKPCVARRSQAAQDLLRP